MGPASGVDKTAPFNSHALQLTAATAEKSCSGSRRPAGEVNRVGEGRGSGKTAALGFFFFYLFRTFVTEIRWLISVTTNVGPSMSHVTPILSHRI